MAKIRKDEEIFEEEEEEIEENGHRHGEDENEEDVYDNEEIRRLPDTIERIYSELDSIRDSLTQIAEAIRSSAEAQKAITEAMEKRFSGIEKAISEILKIDMPEKVDREREKEKYVRPKEPEGVKPESVEEEAKDIVDPKRVARYRMPDYLGGEDEEDVEKSEIMKRAKSVVETPRPETDVRTEPKVADESVDIIKQILGAKRLPSIEEVGEIMKNKYGVERLMR